MFWIKEIKVDVWFVALMFLASCTGSSQKEASLQSNPDLCKETVDSLIINIDENDFNELKLLRQGALKTGAIGKATKEKKQVRIFVNEENSRIAEIQFKGNLLDHLDDEKKWSFNINSKEELLYGWKKMSIQHPKTRGYLKEFLYNRVSRELGLCTTELRLIKVQLIIGNGDRIDLGLMLAQERLSGLSKRLRSKQSNKLIEFGKVDEKRVFNQRFHIMNLTEKDSVLEWFKLAFFSDVVLGGGDHLILRKYGGKARTGCFSNGVLRKQCLNWGTIDLKSFCDWIVYSNLLSSTHALEWWNFAFSIQDSVIRPFATDSYNGYFEGEMRFFKIPIYLKEILKLDHEFRVQLYKSIAQINLVELNAMIEELTCKRNLLEKEFPNVPLEDFDVIGGNHIQLKAYQAILAEVIRQEEILKGME